MQLLEKGSIFLEENKRTHFWLFFIVLTFLSYLMLTFFESDQYMYIGHDIHLHVLRLQALMEALSDGSYPIYMDYDAIIGYGYPTRWFYPDATLIPFAILGNITNVIFAYKTMLVVISILSGISMYVAMNRIYKNTYIASMSGLLYTFSFYRMQVLFERAAVGEAISFIFIPIVFWGLYEIIKGDYKKWYILAIGFTLLIFTHVIETFLTFLTVAIFVMAYCKPLLKEKKRIYYLLLSAGATAILSAYFLFPLLEQMLSNTFYYNQRPLFFIQDFTIPPIMLYWSVFGVNFYPYTETTINLFPGIGILSTIACTRIFIREKSDSIRSVDIGVIIGFIYILMCINIFPWEIYPFKLLNVIQFPWRLYELSTYFFAVASGYYTYKLIKSDRNRGLFTLFIIAALIVMNYVESNNVKNKYEEYRFDTENTVDNFFGQGTLEYAPSKVPSEKFIDKRRDSITTKYKETLISGFERDKRIVKFNVKLADKQEESVELPLFYYKGYEAKLNGKRIPIIESENGLVEISKVDESGDIQVTYAGTFIQKVSPVITIAGILILCIFIFLGNRNLRKKDNK